MTTNLVSALGFDILRDYINLERKIRTQILSILSREERDNFEDLQAYYTALSNITMEVLDEQWDDLFFSNSFIIEVANKDIPSREHTFLNNAQKLHIQRVLNTRRLNIIHSIHRVLRLLKESQKESQKEMKSETQRERSALKSFGSSVISFKTSRHINQDFYPIADPALGSLLGPISAPTVDPALGTTAGYALESSAHHHSTQAAIRTPRWIPCLV